MTLQHSQNSVFSGFLDTVARVPDAPAVIGATETHSYSALSARSDAIRKHLQTRGVKQGDIVALLLERDMDLPASIMAVFGLGAAYVPLEPADPVERHLRALEICQCKTVLCTRGTLNRLLQALLEAKVSPIPDLL